MKLSEVAKDLSRLSLKMLLWIAENIVVTKDKQIYVLIMPKDIAVELEVKSLDKIYKAVKELINAGLIERKRQYIYKVKVDRWGVNDNRE